MSKKQSSQDMSEELKIDGKAVGTVLDSETGLYKTVVMEFNSETGQARILREIGSGGNKTEAAERFKILAVEEGLVV
jgi:hypothetical protein